MPHSPTHSWRDSLPVYFNISIALLIFMGLASGGLFVLALIAGRKQQATFSIMLGLAFLLALIGVFGSVSAAQDLASGLTSALVLLILAFALGYALTAYSVLSPRKLKWRPQPVAKPAQRKAVVCLAPGEPPEYETWSAIRRLEYADDNEDVPPLLLRPFYMQDIRSKYRAVGRSPYRDSHIELSQKVQSRLDSSYRVYDAFYSDHPTLAESVNRALQEGCSRIIIAHVRVTDPPDPVLGGDLLEGIAPESYGARTLEVGPLWNSELLPQIYVRRVLEALPQLNPDAQDIGLLLAGRGHIAKTEAAQARRGQERAFQERVYQALLRLGFDPGHVAMGWLRDRPSIAEALRALAATGCKSVYCMPSSFSADGLNTLYDIPYQANAVAKQSGLRLVWLGAWDADDLAAEEIAAQVRADSGLARRVAGAELRVTNAES